MHFLKKNFVLIFFSSYLLTGLLIWPNMPGNWDELANHRTGVGSFHNINRFLKVWEGKKAGSRGGEHGTAYEMTLLAMEKLTGLEEETQRREIYLLRHLIIFLTFFAASICFYHICNMYFHSRYWGLIGAILFALHPRIFNHSFHNSSDIGFLSFCTIAAFFIFKFIETLKVKWLLPAAFFSAFAVDIRMPGIMLIGFTVMGCVISVLDKRTSFKISFSKLSLYLLVSWVFIVLLWPYLWGEAIHNFIFAFKGMSKLKFTAYMLYLGDSVVSTKLPWHYNFVWIAVTTPIFILVSILLGHLAVVYNAIKGLRKIVFDYKLLTFAGWMWVPLIAPVIFKSTLFDSWRHHFFVYPAMVFFAVYGLVFVFELSRKYFSNRIFMNGFKGIVAAGVLHLLFINISFHPYQALYFNSLPPIFTSKVTELGHRFEVDYWGIGYRAGLEFLANMDHEGKVIINLKRPIYQNWMLLPDHVRDKLEYEQGDSGFQYFMSTYRNTSKEFEQGVYGREVYSKSYNGVKVLTVREYPTKKK